MCLSLIYACVWNENLNICSMNDATNSKTHGFVITQHIVCITSYLLILKNKVQPSKAYT